MAAEEEALASRGQNLEDESSSGGHGTVSFYKLFSFSDAWDKLLIVVGTIAAIGHGLNPALMALLFGELADAFGGHQSGKILPVVSKVHIYARIHFCCFYLFHDDSNSFELVN